MIRVPRYLIILVAIYAFGVGHLMGQIFDDNDQRIVMYDDGSGVIYAGDQETGTFCASGHPCDDR